MKLLLFFCASLLHLHFVFYIAYQNIVNVLLFCQSNHINIFFENDYSYYFNCSIRLTYYLKQY